MALRTAWTVVPPIRSRPNREFVAAASLRQIATVMAFRIVSIFALLCLVIHPLAVQSDLEE